MIELSLQSKEFSPLSPKSTLFIAKTPTDSFGTPFIKKVLIANRGEIACRIIATCRKLGIGCVAVYVTEDRFSRHVEDADEAICVGSVQGAKAGNPFLDIGLLISTAVSVGAQAVHPGYGYLSENPLFAQAVRDAGLIFIGPSAKAMSTLGDKRSSKDYLREHCPSVPLIPGSYEKTEDAHTLETAAQAIGYPVMIKASAGGGGKGMRVVHDENRFREELGRAQSEAQRSFGSQDCILEKYIPAAKHIEVQIIGDSHGNVLSLWERECSVQRRHQKIIEETPCPWITQEKREEMCAVAVQIGELLAYEGAGTVEFVFDMKTSRFFFLEVNTRLQVEHPITEEVTSLDIVALQLYVAAGGDLKLLPALSTIDQVGHAIECRLCAEDPYNDFYPQHGIVRLWKPTERMDNVRFETAIRTGACISIHFDSLIVKIVVWAPTRVLAIDKMRYVLANSVCLGLRTNLGFMQSCLLHDRFRDPTYTTSFIPNNLQSLLEFPGSSDSSWIAQKMALIPLILTQWLGRQATRPFQNVRSGFRNQRHDPVGSQAMIITSNHPLLKDGPLICVSRFTPDESGQELQLSPLSTALRTLGNNEKSSEMRSSPLQVSATYNAISTALRKGLFYAPSNPPSKVILERCEMEIVQLLGGGGTGPWTLFTLQLSVDGKKLQASVSSEHTHIAGPKSSQTGIGQHLYIHLPVMGIHVEFDCFDLLSYCESLRDTMEASSSNDPRTVKAPMPCKVLLVKKKSGDTVKAGESVMVIESMKMEINISVAADGTLETKVNQGDAVDEGSVLCSVQ
ncbi:pyruvate carboxylase subunit A [Pyrenochaeta sp. DS3sAY3a]|nr:pyruvate carboxylase subunit A [Pyrenochaeta sp. DS3sAY3a]